ncbi:unnamed protein product, partial [Choristocarpus tenellus]
ELNRFGGALDSAEGGSLMIAGDEFTTVNGSTHCGSAYIFRLEYGAWEQEAVLVPSMVSRGAHFGQAIDKVYGQAKYTALVGAPGQAAVYAFEYDADSGEWNETQILSVDGVNLPEDGLGGLNSLSLDGDVAVVGARGAEAVYMYYRTPVNSSESEGNNRSASSDNSSTSWQGRKGSAYSKLMSSDFDYDFIHQRKVVHKQEYGASVSLDLTYRTLAVGSPLADYDKLGSDLTETYSTRPEKAESRARGKVYVYYATPAITLGSEFGLSSGSFVLSLDHRNITSNTTQIAWDAPANDFKAAVENLSNVEEVAVTKDEWADGYGFDFYRWKVTFLSEFVSDPSLFKPTWQGSGCSACIAFSSGYSVNRSRLNVTRVGLLGEWEEQAVLQASDRHHGDRFGFNVALDKETLLVGAHHSSALTATTWDFETGDLVGWTQTGTAFALQPTYGDNPFYRRAGNHVNGLLGKPQKSRLKGR